MLFSGCASKDTQPSRLAAASSPTSSSISSPISSSPYVVYPGPGTAAIKSDPICQLAENTAVPAAKRRVVRGECDSLLELATNPVMKPVLPPPSPSPPQPSAQACVASNLRARFEGGGFGTGSDFGVIIIWNPTAQPCELQGGVTFAGYNADGSRDHAARLNRPIHLPAAVLSPRMALPRDGNSQDSYVVGYLMGPERDDPNRPNGLCRPEDEGAPASFALSIGSSRFHVLNEDPAAPQVKSVYDCHGRVLLDDVHGPFSG